MTNKEIAKNLYQIAKILELGKEKEPSGAEPSRFRIVAYERAAQEIEKHPDELELIYKRGGINAINDIPGVGESIAEKIEEMIKTGKLKYLREISEKVPSAEIEFIKIPGIGPKTAIKIAKELKAKDIKDLKRIIENGKADEVFESKTRENILRGIEILGKLSGRMIITDALPIAEEYVERIRKINSVKKCDFVGSLRRMKETIGDIDIVAATDFPEKVISEFIKFSGIENVVTQGKSKSTIIHKIGTQIDLEIVPEEEYGSLLQHFTGSKEHNIGLRTYAQTKNLSISEHGIKSNGKLITFKTEKEMYSFLKMDYIEPELRENGGEISAALNKKLPTLIELTDIKGDLHIHSNWSDGQMSIEEIAQTAEKMNYEYICISDHTIGLGIANGLNEKRLQDREKEIEKARKKHPKIQILSGAEVNIKANGDLDIADWMLERLDLVTASVHTSFNQEKDVMTERIIGAIKHPHVDIIGHPSGRIIGMREPYEADWTKIFVAAAKEKTALEISSYPNRLDLKDSLCREAKSLGVRFTINTDSHELDHLLMMRFGVAVARRGWLEKGDIINSQHYEDLVKWARRS